MDAQRTQDIDAVAEATEKLLATIGALTDTAIHAPSGLPGWTRGHVLAHIEGNARGLARLVRQLGDGIERPMYVSRDVRNADVTLHATWSAAAHRGAVAQSAEEFELDVRAVPDERWVGTVTLGNGTVISVDRVLPQRLLEVCVHHSDLDVPTYTWLDWPERLAEFFLPVLTDDFRNRGGFVVDWVQADDGERVSVTERGETGVRGDSLALLAWLLGRSDGAGLVAVGLDAVPPAPTWV